MLRLAIIGTGLIAHDNYLGLVGTGKVKIISLCNRTLHKGIEFADRYGLECPVYTDYREMVEKEKPEIVLINTPHDLHEEIFNYCADKKINIIIEKPLSESFVSAQRILSSAIKNNIKASVCHTQRFYSPFITAKEYLKKNDCGKLISVSDIITYNYFWEGRPEWFLDPVRAGGGIVMNYGVHQLDRVHFMAGGCTKSIFAHIDWEKDGVAIDSSYQIMGIMNNGVSYNITCTGYTGPFINTMQLNLSKGILRISMTDTGIETFGSFFGDNRQKDFIKLPLLNPENKAFNMQMSAIVDFMDGTSDEPPVSLEYAAEMVRLVQKAQESNEKNMSVMVD
jgi:predicted dehydrogenase